jgi:hypothetical protein
LVFTCVGAGVFAQPQALASPSAPVADLQGSTPSSGEVTTRSGNHLTGQILRVDCHGLSLQYFGNTLVVPLDKIATASSAAEVSLFPGTGNDRLSGRLQVKGATLYISTHDLGKVALPIAAIQCQSSQGGKAVDIGKHSRTHADNRPEVAPKRVSSSPNPTRDREVSAAAMALLSGAGSEPASQDRGGQGTRLLNGSATAQNSSAVAQSNATPETGPATQNASGGSPQPAAKPSAITKEEEEETERNVLEFLRAEAVVVQPGKVEGDFSLFYLHTNQLLGNEKVVGFNSTARVGITRDLEGFIALPLVWGQRQTTELTSVISNELKGVGDLRFGLKYRTVNEGLGIPDVVMGVSALAPTGRPPYLAPTPGARVAGDTRDPLNIQIGTGHWALTGSATAFKSYDPLVLYTTLNYIHFIPATYYSVHIAPGDIWELNSGFGFSVNDSNTLSAQLFIDYAEKWQFNSVPVSQTGITPITLKLSYIHVLSPNNLIQPSVLFGLTRDATDAVVQLDYIHRF